MSLASGHLDYIKAASKRLQTSTLVPRRLRRNYSPFAKAPIEAQKSLADDWNGQ